MMKKLCISLFLFLAVLNGVAQEKLPKIKIGGFGGKAMYSFDNLESINQSLMRNLPFETALINDFPSQFYFGGYVMIRMADWYSLGPAYEFHSTGSRVGEKDYSGLYYSDQILSTHQLGIENEIKIIQGEKPSVFLELTGGVNFSTWEMKKYLEVTEVLQNDETEFFAVKPFVLPAVKISFPVYKDFKIFTRAGYLFDLGGKYHELGNKDYQVTQKIPWSGFRVSLGLEWEIN